MDNSDFDIQKEIEAYAAHITHDIRPIKKRESIKSEFISHIEDAVYHYMISGLNEQDAFKRACDEIGDVEKIKRMLTIVHKKDKISTVLFPIIYCFALIIAFLPFILSSVKIDYILEQWINLISVVTAIALFCFTILKSYKYLRALFKRVSLIRKIKKICQQNNYCFSYDRNYYLSIFGKSSKHEMKIIGKEKTIYIKMFACLKRKDIYTLTSINSFFTSNNVNPIFVSYDYPSIGSVLKKESERKMYLPRFYQSRNNYVKEDSINPEVDAEIGADVINILCINPISAKIEVVRTNRAEEVFDGDEFKGYIVYSGNGLCDFLKRM
ncbi:MAG: hypothetical protein IJW53_05745 [Clostridia bacterium]|nr:hypothetical protein [Clostridia bacterium]